MNDKVFARTRALVGAAGMEKLAAARVAVFGLGGVGSYCAEALARSGVGRLTLVDGDHVTESNCNRQLVADLNTIGRKKAEVAAERVRAVNPEAEVRAVAEFFTPERAAEWDFGEFDCVVDAVDDRAAKTAIVAAAKAAGTWVMSCMGTGNRLDPSLLRVGDISETEGCPLARRLRREWRQMELGRVRVVYSLEEPIVPEEELGEGKRTVASAAFVPGAAGLLLASEVVREIAGKTRMGEKK